jgi:nitroreductase
VGRVPVVELTGPADRPDHVFTVRGEVGEAPSVLDLADHAAIDTVATLGEEVEPEPVEPSTVGRIAAAGRWPGTGLRPLAGDAEAVTLADLALHAYRRLDGDHRLNRELAPWTEPPGRSAGAVPASGSAAPTTVAEPRSVLCRAMAERIAEGAVLFALAADDGRHDQVFTGAAMQSARLAAARVGLGLVAMTRLLHLPEVRAELIDRLALPGYPQAVLRLGQPVTRRRRWDRR